MKVEVTEEDIRNGKMDRCLLCPVALAMKRTLGKEVEVYHKYYWIAGRGQFELPTVAQDFIRDREAVHVRGGTMTAKYRAELWCDSCMEPHEPGQLFDSIVEARKSAQEAGWDKMHLPGNQGQGDCCKKCLVAMVETGSPKRPSEAKWIPLDQLLFIHRDLDQHLLDSITKRGILMPLTVKERPDGLFEVLAGHARANCAAVLKRPTVPCLVVTR